MATKSRGVTYIGVTNNLVRRVYEHQNNLIDGFTKKYNVHNLVYYEQYEQIESAIKREKQLKNWQESWKFTLIETMNPTWKNLYYEIV